MISPEEIDLEGHKGLIRSVLRGEQTPSSHPWVFQDDLLFNALFVVESKDPTWLSCALFDAESTPKGRQVMAGFLFPQRREALRDLLGADGDRPDRPSPD